MDFIKIPFYKSDDTIGETAIRISNISSFHSSMDEKGGTIIYFTDISPKTSPMSVSKIYDLIWQTELSNQFREPMKMAEKGGEK